MSHLCRVIESSRALSVLGLLGASLVLACGVSDRPGSADVLANVGDQSITRSEVEGQIADQLARMDHEYRLERHELIEQTLRRTVRERLLRAEAEAQGVTLDRLAAQIQANVTVTEADARDWYETNHRSLGGRSYEELADRIQEFLLNTGRQKAMTDFARDLERQKGVVYHLEPFRVELNLKGAPAKGPADAPDHAGRVLRLPVPVLR